jgi:hypothetical protein
MNDAVDKPGLPDSRDQLEQLMEQAREWSKSDSTGQLIGQARAWMKGDHMSHLAEQARAWRQTDPMSHLTEQTRAWMRGDYLSHLAEQTRVLSKTDHLSQLADQARAWMTDDHTGHLAQQARLWSRLHDLSPFAGQAKAWVKGDHLSQLAEQARTWRQIDPVSQMADQVRAWLTGDHLELARQTIPQDLTFKALISELASRSSTIVEAPTSSSDMELVSAEEIESVSIGDLYAGEVNPARNAKPTLSGAPTWLLYLWLLCIAPALAVLTHWEDVRQGLVDINERIPEKYSFSGLKRFIRTNLAGKPGDIRLVTGSDVRLRVAPGMKSAVLLTLPEHAAVVVLDKEDRTWLYVSYEHEGFLIDGYVSTKFLRKVRK